MDAPKINGLICCVSPAMFVAREHVYTERQRNSPVRSNLDLDVARGYKAENLFHCFLRMKNDQPVFGADAQRRRRKTSRFTYFTYFMNYD